MFSFLNKKIINTKKQNQQIKPKLQSNENLITFNNSNSSSNNNIESPIPVSSGGGILSGYFTTGRSLNNKKRASLNLG
jgi:hypothetical protein